MLARGENIENLRESFRFLYGGVLEVCFSKNSVRTCRAMFNQENAKIRKERKVNGNDLNVDRINRCIYRFSYSKYAKSSIFD